MTATILETMPKPKQEVTEQVRLPKSVVRRLRRLSSHLDKDPKDIMLEPLLPFIRKLEDQMLADLQHEHHEQTPVTEPAKRKRP